MSSGSCLVQCGHVLSLASAWHVGVGPPMLQEEAGHFKVAALDSFVQGGPTGVVLHREGAI